MKKLFSRCFIVGRSFPVAHVHVEGEVIEVTSFSTNADSSLIPADAASYLEGGSGGGGGLRRAGGKVRCYCCCCCCCRAARVCVGRLSEADGIVVAQPCRWALTPGCGSHPTPFDANYTTIPLLSL